MVRVLVLVWAMLASLAFAGSAAAQDVTLKAGESADVSPVYWIASCKSLLMGFAGVDVLSGPPEIKASIREEPVLARRQGCTEKVKGGMLVISAGDVSAPFEGTVRLRVRYKTEDGDKQSNHQVKVALLPGK